MLAYIKKSHIKNTHHGFLVNVEVQIEPKDDVMWIGGS